MDDQFTPQLAAPQSTQPQPQQPAVIQPQPSQPSRRRSVKGPLIVLLILLIAAGVAYGVYAWQHKKVNDANAKSASLQAQVLNLQGQVDKLSQQIKGTTQSSSSTANWTAYSSKDDSFSLKYPNGWVLAANQSACSNNTVLLGPTAASAGTCGSQNPSQVTITYSNHACAPLGNTFTDATTASITVSSKSGKRYTGTTSSTSNFNGLPANSKVIQYCIPASTTGYTYNVSYVQTPSFSDASADFDLLVNSTLQLNK